MGGGTDSAQMRRAATMSALVVVGREDRLE
jgi:hypothetical protein